MPRLLIVHHTVSPPLDSIHRALVEGASTPELEGVEVVSCAALTASPVDVLDADGYLLSTPANLGSMAGALKHFFDTIYYPCLDQTQRRPWGCVVHGNDDVGGAIRDIGRIVTGLAWRQVADPLAIVGAPSGTDLEASWELAATVGASLEV